MDSKINIITKEWYRHGSYSGYEKIIPNLTLKKKLIRSFIIPFIFAEKLKTLTKLVNYSTGTLSKELVVFKFPINKTIYVLYGDTDFFYLHYLNRGIFKLLNNKLIVTFHNPPQEMEKRFNYDKNKVLGSIDKIIVMGTNQISYLKQYSSAKIKFIPHGIDTNYFKPNQSIKKKNQILIIGISHRNHERNVEIIKLLSDFSSKIMFKVIVPVKIAHYYNELKNVEVITSKIDDETLLNYYHTSKGTLLSLTDCTASNSILEALATGCPLIVNNVGSVKDYIPEKSELPVFENNEIKKQVLFVKRILEDHSYAFEISNKQRKLSLNYDWSIITRITENFILN